MAGNPIGFTLMPMNQRKHPDGLMDSPYYVECTDPECPVAYAYRSPFPEGPHWHFIGSPHHPPEAPENHPQAP